MQVTVVLAIAAQTDSKTKPTDQTKAIVKIYDENGIDFGDEMALDATTSQTTVALALVIA